MSGWSSIHVLTAPWPTSGWARFRMVRLNCGSWKCPVTSAKYMSWLREGRAARCRASAMSPSPPFSSVAFGPSVWVLMMMFWPVSPEPSSQPQMRLGRRARGDVRGEHERGAGLAARGQCGQLGAGRVADPDGRAAGIAGGRQARCRRIGRGERVVLVDDLIVGQPGPGDDHAEHPGVLRVEQRNRLEYALEDRIRQRGSVRRVIDGRQGGDLARHVAAGRRLGQIQRELWRHGPDHGDPAPGRRPERLGVAADDRVAGRVQAEIDQAAGHAAGRRLPGVGIVIGQRDRARPARGRGDADRQGELAGQPAAEGQPVGLHPEAGHRRQLPGQPVHIGRMTAAARITGSEPDELLLPLPHLRQARHARGRTAGCHIHPRSSSRAGLKSGPDSLLTTTTGGRRTTRWPLCRPCPHQADLPAGDGG